MSSIDFTEIRSGDDGKAPNVFELFARDFLEALGFNVLEGPDEGRDGGRDLIVSESVSG